MNNTELLKVYEFSPKIRLGTTRDDGYVCEDIGKYDCIPQILAIIPARCGSKGIVDKNIMLYKGKPLLAWSIEEALKSKYKLRTIVSTDSEHYASIAREYGGETPFLRPSDISLDSSTTLECIRHCLSWLKSHESYVPEVVILLQPTSPRRTVKDIDACLDLFLANKNAYDSLCTLCEADVSPYKMFSLINGLAVPLFREVAGISEPYIQCRQALPMTYSQNGSIYIFHPINVQTNTYLGEKIIPYIMNDYLDIDSIDDFM